MSRLQSAEYRSWRHEAGAWNLLITEFGLQIWKACEVEAEEAPV